MDSNLQIKSNPGCKELLLKKLSYAVTTSIISQIILLSVYLFAVNFSVSYPLQWLTLTCATLTSISTWLYVIPFLSIIFAQSMICAKDYVFKSPYSTSRIQKFLSVVSLRNVLLFGLHVFSGGLITWLYLSLAGGQYSSLFTLYNQDHYSLNIDSFYLISCGLWTGFYFFSRIYRVEKRILFSVIHQPKLLQFKTELIPLIQDSIRTAFWPTTYFFIIYFFWGETMENYISSTFKLHKPNASFSYITILFSWFFSTLYIFIMNLMRFFFELFLTEPIDFPILSVNKDDLTLTYGISVNTIPVIQHLASFDLFLLARNSIEKRKTLFTLSQPGNHPHNWNNLVTNILNIISNFTGAINLSANSILTPESNKKVDAASTAQFPIHKNYFYNMRNLNTGNLQVPLDVINVTQNKSLPFSSPVHSFMDKTIQKMNAFTAAVKARFGINYLFGRLPLRNIQCCLEDGQIIIWITQGLSNLAVASLKEDTFGIAHKDLPIILSTLVELKLSMEKLNRIPAFTRKAHTAEDFKIKMKAGINSAVKRSLYNICKHFGPYVHDIPIKKDLLQYLQPYFLES